MEQRGLKLYSIEGEFLLTTLFVDPLHKGEVLLPPHRRSVRFHSNNLPNDEWMRRSRRGLRLYIKIEEGFRKEGDAVSCRIVSNTESVGTKRKINVKRFLGRLTRFVKKPSSASCLRQICILIRWTYLSKLARFVKI